MAKTRYLLLAVVLAACVDQPGAVECPTGIVCPAGASCAAAQPVCIVNPCGNGRVDQGETCDDGNIMAGDGCSPTCGKESCGNGLVEPGERCDDGNTMSGDGCSGDCLSLEQCGNGIKDVGEGCDDGNTAKGDGCRADCKAIEFCGNGLVDPGEVCDDGMAVGGPCSPDCQSGLGCGNGFIDVALGEECDDGNTNDDDDCRFPSCKIAVCGDGVRNMTGTHAEQCDGGVGGVPTETVDCNIDCTNSVCGDGKVNQVDHEQCDNGTGLDSSSCDSDCTAPVCGDGHTNTLANETCDPGTVGADTATCDSDCTSPSCGDNHVNKSFIPTGSTIPEGCDDGGTTAGDGCSGLCQIESCGNGVTEAVNGEQCDDANTNDVDGCRNNCQLPRCGDGIKSNSETCDDGADTATCDHDCTMPACNDGITNAAAGEQCEDGNTMNGDGCSSTCKLEPFVLTAALAGNGTGTITSNPTGINCGADCNELFLAGTVVTLNATPGATSTFVGWSGACMGSGACVVTMSQTRSVTATFAANRLTVTKSGAGTGTITGGGISCGSTCTQDYTVGTIVTLTPAPSGDSVFTGWSGACTGMGTCTVTMNSATSVNANFELDLFPLSVSQTGGGNGTVTSVPAGIDCGTTCAASFTANSIVTLVASPAADSNFTGWSGACTGTSTCAVTMTQAKSVTASFVLKPITLTVNVTAGGTVTSTPAGINCSNATCSASFPAGQMVVLHPNPASNKAFTAWGGACTGTLPSSDCTVTMDVAKTVTATFETNRLTVVRTGTGTGTVTASGINCGGNCTQDYNQGTAVAATATPASGSVFVGWSGPCTGTGTCNLTMNGPVTLTAEFADASTLTVTRTGTGGGTVTSTPAGISCGATCAFGFQTGSTVMLSAVADGSSVFTGWSGGGCSGFGTCTVTLSADTTVAANFVPARALMVTISGTGTVTSSPGSINCSSGTCSDTFAENTIVTLTATTAPTWTGDCSACTGTSCAITISADTACTATFP